jgi:hypothetical protein
MSQTTAVPGNPMADLPDDVKELSGEAYIIEYM